MNRSPNKILIVAHHYPPHITGVGMVAHQQAKRLVQAGYDVTVITSNTGLGEQSTVVDGVNVIRIRALNFPENLWNAPFPIFSPALFLVMRQRVKAADIVHIHDAFYMSSFVAALWAQLYKKPIVLTQHVAMIAHPSKIIVGIQKLVYASTGAFIFRISNSVLVYNDQVKSFLERRRLKNKVIILQNGVDTEVFHRVPLNVRNELKKKFGVSLDKKILLFVGRFVPKKGFDKVLAIRGDEYLIVCTGGSPPKEKLDNVLFLGKLDQKTLTEVYQLADIFILPSESEGFPLSIQEAMASGVPIITTKDPGYAQYGFNENLMCFIENPTAENLKRAVLDILHNDTQLRAMAEYGEAYALSHFSWPSIITKLEKIYSNALTQKKRIAFISDAIYPFNKGGKEKRLYDITTRLAAHGYDVTVYCMNWWHGPKTFEKDGVTFEAISPLYALYAGKRRSISEATLFALHCFKLFYKKFDIVDVDHIPHPVLFVMKLVCMIKRKRMIVTWHEVWGKAYWMEYAGSLGLYAYWIEKLSASLPDTIISVSEHTTSALREVLGRTKEVITIPNGLDIAEISSNAPGAITSDLIFAGRLLSHKHIDVLLRALQRLIIKMPALSLIIIGEGPERAPLEHLASELNIKDNVFFHDFFDDHATLYRTMRASKVFVLPSTREGFGIVVLEANACGLPIVTVDHPENAAKDLIVSGKNGLVTQLDENHLADAMERSLQSRSGRDDYRPYIEQYDWNNIISKILAVYN